MPARAIADLSVWCPGFSRFPRWHRHPACLHSELSAAFGGSSYTRPKLKTTNGHGFQTTKHTKDKKGRDAPPAFGVPGISGVYHHTFASGHSTLALSGCMFCQISWTHFCKRFEEGCRRHDESAGHSEYCTFDTATGDSAGNWETFRYYVQRPWGFDDRKFHVRFRDGKVVSAEFRTGIEADILTP